MKAPRALPTIDSVVRAHLCTGCGVCAYLQPGSLTMADVPAVGRRPLPIIGITEGRGPQAASVPGDAVPGGTVASGTVAGDTAAGDPVARDAVLGDAVAACPGRRLEHTPGALKGAPFGGAWGPVLALYECWATDPEVRFRGSSGGVISALAAHAVDSGSAVGVLQVQARGDDPLKNETVVNSTYAQIVGAAGSRYAPASPCERLDLVEHAGGPCVVVGKPCDIAATQAASAHRPSLAANVGLTIAIFCAGTPSANGTHEVIRRLGAAPADVTRLDYRGEGWPGRFRIRTRSGEERSLSYDESWGETLHKHRQWRCMICPDHTGEFADVSVGDPWYRPVREGEAGRSLVVVRTERGRAAVLAALADGAIAGGELPLDRLPESQPHLQTTRGAVWGRVLTLRLAGVPAPTYRRLPAARLWLRLPWRAKVTSVGGTWRRIGSRRLREPEFTAAEVER